MRRVLIAGEGSYIGTRLSAWLANVPDRFAAHTLDMRGDGWQTFDFAGFDAVVLVAGIAHLRETSENEPLYDAVNHRLAVAAAARAKAAGVSQFVFFSSMSVYGLTTGRITADTAPAPTSAYGRSKLAAEAGLAALADDAFRVATLRPPMIYGPGCRGNYPRLSALVQKLSVFPRVTNERSMLYIDMLCAFVEALLQSGAGGLYFPQNPEYVRTDALAAAIARAHGRRLWQPRGLGWLLHLLAPRVPTIGKVFGTLTYAQDMSKAFAGGEIIPFAETVRRTEAGA
jgi:UDP-glucose 4-epimerase